MLVQKLKAYRLPIISKQPRTSPLNKLHLHIHTKQIKRTEHKPPPHPLRHETAKQASMPIELSRFQNFLRKNAAHAKAEFGCNQTSSYSTRAGPLPPMQ